MINDPPPSRGPVVASGTFPVRYVCDTERYMLVGSLGGAMVGFFSGYFDPNRIPPATSPLPPSASPKSHTTSRLMIQSSALGWRIFKRMFVASFLYPFVVCTLQGERRQASILQCGVSGSVCGAIFGLRGGPLGMVNGSVSFFIFATMAEAYKQWRGV